jgi:hypothetical protein
MRSTAGEIEFWKSLTRPATPEIICQKFGLTGANRRSFEELLQQACRTYKFHLLPEDERDKRGCGADHIWSRADYLAAGRLAIDLLRKTDQLLKYLARRHRRSGHAGELPDALLQDWLPKLPHRAEMAPKFNADRDQVSLVVTRLPKEPAFREHLLHLRSALYQVKAHCGLYKHRSIEPWAEAVSPLFVFARDRLRMHPSASFGRGHNPPAHLRAEWDKTGEGKTTFYPVLSTPMQKLLFECMRVIDEDRARATVLRSMLSYWVTPPGKRLTEGEPPPKLHRQKNRTSISKGVA